MNWKRTTIAALLLSFGLVAGASAQDDHHERDEHHRYYDSYRHDYHNWTPEEDGYYHRWYGDTYRGREYREFDRLNHRDQRRYWEWRHQHEEHEEHERH